MVFLDFLDFLEFLETSEVAGPGPNPREIDISFGAQWPLACARPDPTIGWTDVLPCVFVCVWGRYPPAAALLVRRLVVPVLNKLLQLPLHPLAGAWRVLDFGRAHMIRMPLWGPTRTREPHYLYSVSRTRLDYMSRVTGRWLRPHA